VDVALGGLRVVGGARVAASRSPSQGWQSLARHEGWGPGDWGPALSAPHQVAAVLTLPFDVVKTQRQVALGALEAVRGEGSGWCGAGRMGAQVGSHPGHASHPQ